jgi:preprotein translocase subunit SecG
LLNYLYLAQIIVSITLITLILLQGKGANLGGIFGSDSSVYRSRRGIEKTLFQANVGLSVVFFVMALITVVVAR